MKFLLLLISATVCFANPLQKEAAKCGVPAIKPDTSTNIIGGKDAIPYSWPWQASVARTRNETYFSHTCGGTLISNQWLLCAGHCFGDTKVVNYVIKFGVFNQFKDNEPGELVVKVAEIHVHPKFATQSPKYDISLVKLAKPIEFTDHISPVCLPTQQDEEQPEGGTNIFLTGWGKTKPGFSGNPNIPVSDILKQVAIPILAKDKCESLVGSAVGKVSLCFGGPGTGKSACFGDSGGPAVMQDKANDGRFKQIGITSRGLGLEGATCTGYSIYTKISSSLDFIKQYVKDL